MLRRALRAVSAPTLEEAIAYARGDQSSARRATGRVSLTPAEIAVVRLVSSGLTNAEVAGRMEVSVATIETQAGRVPSRPAHRPRTAPRVS